MSRLNCPRSMWKGKQLSRQGKSWDPEQGEEAHGADGVSKQSMENLPERTVGRISKGRLVGLDSSDLGFLCILWHQGEGDSVMADTGEHLHVRDEGREDHERGRKEAKRSERTRELLQTAEEPCALGQSASTLDLGL